MDSNQITTIPFVVQHKMDPAGQLLERRNPYISPTIQIGTNVSCPIPLAFFYPRTYSLTEDLSKLGKTCELNKIHASCEAMKRNWPIYGTTSQELGDLFKQEGIKTPLWRILKTVLASIGCEEVESAFPFVDTTQYHRPGLGEPKGNNPVRIIPLFLLLDVLRPSVSVCSLINTGLDILEQMARSGITHTNCILIGLYDQMRANYVHLLKSLCMAEYTITEVRPKHKKIVVPRYDSTSSEDEDEKKKRMRS